MLDTGAQFAFVHEVAHAHADAVHLVTVAGTDTAARSADGSLAGLLFLRLVERGVVREHHVGVVRDEQAAFGIDSLRVEVGNLGERLDGVEHDTVTDDANLVLVHNARGNQVEHELLVAHLDGVARVRAALETHDDIRIERQEIHNLRLSFIAPLGADYNTICHISFIFVTWSTALAGRPRVDYCLNTKLQRGELPRALFRHKDSKRTICGLRPAAGFRQKNPS